MVNGVGLGMDLVACCFMLIVLFFSGSFVLCCGSAFVV